MGDGVVVVGVDGIILFVNPAAERLFGRDASQLLGSDLGLPMVSGESAEIDVVRPGGDPVSVELRVVDTQWEGQPARLATLRDVTERRRAEEVAAQLTRERLARAEVEAASRAKSEFLATMSHELRTPLNAVIGYAELLELGIDGALTESQKQRIVRILAGARHLRSLVTEVLDLAKADAGQLRMRWEVCEAGMTANEALTLVQPLAEARSISISERCAGELNAKYEGDMDRVRQILVNLLENAVKFSEPGGAVAVRCGRTTEPDLSAQLSPGGAWVYLSVSDSGPGIPNERLAAIFEPFVQLEAGHTRQVDGSGLGLAIGRRLARAMNGDLTVHSEVGKGSTFTLWLPQARTETATGSGDAFHEVSVGAESGVRAGQPGLAHIGRALLRGLEPLLDAIVGRVRSARLAPTANGLGYSQVADHLATYLANVAEALMAAGEARHFPSPVILSCSEIQRLAAECHGEQRAGLGWTADAMRREWEIIREEVDRVVRALATSVPDSAIVAARAFIARLAEQAEEASERALMRLVRHKTADGLLNQET